MRKSTWVSVFCACLILAGGAFAKTPDGKPPSVETICDNEHGAAYGLCVAYCEAMDCLDPNQHASDQGCQSVKKNFEKKTGRPLPCTLTCPCEGVTELAAQITAGTVMVQQCIMTNTTLFVRIVNPDQVQRDFTLLAGGIQPSCGANGQPSTVPLTGNESLACRITLRKAVESQGLLCVFPE